MRHAILMAFNFGKQPSHLPWLCLCPAIREPFGLRWVGEYSWTNLFLESSLLCKMAFWNLLSEWQRTTTTDCPSLLFLVLEPSFMGGEWLPLWMVCGPMPWEFPNSNPVMVPVSSCYFWGVELVRVPQMVQVVKGFVLSFYFIKMLYIHMFINTNLSMSRHSLCIVPPGPAQHQQSQRHDRPTVAATVAQAKDRLSSVTSLGQNRLILCLSLSLSPSLSLSLSAFFYLSLSLFPSIYIYIYIYMSVCNICDVYLFT